jgi:two-component system cell cycle sensor histidine kinase/response regulator CckA
MIAHMRELEERYFEWSHDERCEQLVELAPDAIFIHDGEIFTFANIAAVHLAGAVDRTEIVGKSVELFLDPPFLKDVAFQLTNGETPRAPARPMRDTFRRLDGTRVEVETRSLAFIFGGHASVHLVVRDIRERVAIELALHDTEFRLQQAQRMEAVGALAGGVAHEVNNMMAVVLGLTEFLMQDSALSPESLADVAEISKAAARAADVTRQLLAFSQRAFNRPGVVMLEAVVQRNEAILRRQFGSDRTLVIEVNATPPVFADAAQLDQILVNLALNARDAVPPSGTVTIRTGHYIVTSTVNVVPSGTMPPGEYSTITVTDNGMGMDASTITHIFEPFFTTRSAEQRTGLGLSAVTGLVSQSNGFITLTSVLGQGSTFTVFLPSQPDACNSTTPEDSDVQPSSFDLRTSTVLVVDDEASIRDLIVRSLARVGIVTMQASSGASALRIVEEFGAPTLVVTDLLMPGMTGTQLASRLREQWPQLPVLFISGDLGAVDQRGSIPLDREHMIQKPFHAAALVQRVVLALERASADRNATH